MKQYSSYYRFTSDAEEIVAKEELKAEESSQQPSEKMGINLPSSHQ